MVSCDTSKNTEIRVFIVSVLQAKIIGVIFVLYTLNRKLKDANVVLYLKRSVRLCLDC